jgi:hypothetical protein
MSHLEDQLALQIKAMKLPEPEREYLAIPGRRFRFDFGWPLPVGVLVEVQGAVFVKGAHSTGTGITRDCEKASLAAVHGYRLLPVTAQHIKSGAAIDWILRALGYAT